MEKEPHSEQLSRFLTASFAMLGLFVLACFLIALAPPFLHRLMGGD